MNDTPMISRYQDSRSTSERLYVNSIQYYQKAVKSDGTRVVYFYDWKSFRVYEGFDDLADVADNRRELESSEEFGTEKELSEYMAGK